MGLSTAVLTAIHGGIHHLAELAEHLGRDKHDIVKAVQVLKGRALVEIVAANDFDALKIGHGRSEEALLGGKIFVADVPTSRYVLTDAGAQHAQSGLPINPGQGVRPRKKTIGLRERAWWQLHNSDVAVSLEKITSTHADGHEKAASINVYKYLIALERAGLIERLDKRIPAKQSKGRLQWKLTRKIGPKPPVWRQQAREVYDPNSGQTYPIIVKDNAEEAQDE